MPPLKSPAVELTVNQAILRGYGSDVNLVRLQQARLDTCMSEYELRGFTLALVAEVEETFWDYALAGRQVEIFEESLKVARQQVNETLSQLVELDVRTAYIEVNRAKQQIKASSTTRMFNEETLRVETEKLRVGKSTSLLVAQAQRDLLISKISEVDALANYIKALITLYRQDGSLLERRGIGAPGGEPVTFSKS